MQIESMWVKAPSRERFTPPGQACLFGVNVKCKFHLACSNRRTTAVCVAGILVMRFNFSRHVGLIDIH